MIGARAGFDAKAWEAMMQARAIAPGITQGPLRDFLAHPLRYTRHRMASIFREDSVWLEFSSALALVAFGGFMVVGKGPEDYRSLDLLTELFPGSMAATITAVGGLIQLLGVFFNSRFMRASAAMGAVLWMGAICFLVWPIFPWSPFLAATVAWAFPNLLVVARHARDW